MILSNKYWILNFLFLITLGLEAQSPRAFYIGHSLSDQIPDMVQSLSNDHSEVNFSWVYQSIPGAPLRWQWDRLEAKDYTHIEPNYYGFYDEKNGLPAGNFDVLVLTESVPRYEAIIDETYQYADSFYRYATEHNPDLRVYLYEDWHCILSGTPTGCHYDVDSNPWRQRLEDDLPMWESVVDSLNKRFAPETPVCLIPAGQGLAALYDSIQIGAIPDISSINDIFSDDIHFTDIGKYFVACIHFAMIHETSPVGLTNQTQVWWGGDFDAPSEELALKFQEMAWETVQRYPRSCVSSAVSSNQVFGTNSVSIYPNPAVDFIEVNGLVGSSEILILDSAGRLVMKRISNKGSEKINLEQLTSGLYFVKLISEEDKNHVIKKVIKRD
jgi:hypothetical protein